MSQPAVATSPSIAETRRAVLMLRAGEQRELVRWWAAECRARNSNCRRRFTSANVAAATEARRILRRYAAAWSETRKLIRTLDYRAALNQAWNDLLDEREAERDARDEERHEAYLRSPEKTGRI